MSLTKNMSLTNIVESSSSKPFYRYHRQFVLCESCFWSATSLYSVIIEKQNSETVTNVYILTQKCPMCNKDNVVLIPLQKDEAYQMSVGTKEGLKCNSLY